MWMKARNYFNIIILLLPLFVNGEDSLKSALNAVNRRQRDLSDYQNVNDDYDDDNLAFLSPSDNYNNLEKANNDLETSLMEYLEEGSAPYYEKAFSSPFRERVEIDKAKHKELLAQQLLNRYYYNMNENDDGELMAKIYRKYHQPKYENYRDIAKRYYNNLGFGSVGMKKRSRYFQPDGPSESLYLLNYAPRDELFNRLEEDEKHEFWNKYPRERKAAKLRYSTAKRFPITKRSSNQQKTSLLKKTDPKIEKDLNNIFNPKKKIVVTKKASVKSGSWKEELPKAIIPQEKPLDMKKKSINWSDYFGLDKRSSKPTDNDLDDEWLVERYHKAIAVATKRNVNNVQSSKKLKKEEDSIGKINEMDEKMKNIEESIIDDALKVTGAHEGSVDPKEIQEVKARVISRLAAAYNLEKIRNALKEYKKSLEKQDHTLNNNNNNNNNNNMDNINENKRLSVPRKQAIDEEREKPTNENNNIIKCTENEDCDEQNYKIPIEILEQVNLYNKGECPKIERACNEVSSIFGNYNQMFEIACNMHQMCLLCGDNSWFSPTRQCNILFLSKADQLCEDDEECKKVARQSVKYLLRVNRSLRNDPYSACDMECPDERRRRR